MGVKNEKKRKGVIKQEKGESGKKVKQLQEKNYLQEKTIYYYLLRGKRQK